MFDEDEKARTAEAGRDAIRVLSLCSGIGGIDLACEWAGFQIVGQVENNPFCQMLLQQHFPGVPLLSDLKEVAAYEKEKLIKTFGRVDFLVGGIPCQPFSSAGKRRGTADGRYLWPYVFTLIEKLQPTWILVENVRNFTILALDLVLFDLESAEYEARAFVFPIAATGAPHIRERCFILAYSNSNRQRQRAIQYERQPQCSGAPKPGNDGTQGFMANPDRQGLAVGQCFSRNAGPEFQTSERIHNSTAGGDLAAQSRMGGMLDGISARLDAARWPAPPGPQYKWEPSRTVKGHQKWRRKRLEALGNACSPYQIWPFVALLKESEEQTV